MTVRKPGPQAGGATRSLSGEVSLFGFPSNPAAVEARPRSPGWRRLRGGGFFLGGLVLAPVLGMVPPHAPWAVGALGVGGFLGARKWKERFTLVGFEGSCPKCGASLSMTPGVPLREEMSVSCHGCHHDSRLIVALPPEGLAE